MKRHTALHKILRMVMCSKTMTSMAIHKVLDDDEISIKKDSPEDSHITIKISTP